MIEDLINKDLIMLDVKGDDKNQVILDIVDNIISCLPDLDKVVRDDIYNSIIERERLGSTGIGGFVAFPHGKTSCVQKIISCLAVCPDGVIFDSLDGNLVNIIFLVLIPINFVGQHIKILAQMGKILQKRSIVQDILSKGSQEDVYHVLFNAYSKP